MHFAPSYSSRWMSSGVLIVSFVLGSVGFLLQAAQAAQGSIVAWNSYGRSSWGVPTGDDFVAVAAGNEHSLALRADGSLVAWLGARSDASLESPPSGNDFVAIAAGNDHALALRADGSIAAWGDDGFGTGRAHPPPNVANTGFTAISAGYRHNLALKADGSIVAWGSDGTGNLTTGRAHPPPGVENKGFVAIAAGETHNLAVKSDGTIVAWGEDVVGEVSDAPTGSGFLDVAVAFGDSIALKDDGTVVWWGSEEHVTPSMRHYYAIAAGNYQALGLYGDGRIGVIWTEFGWTYDNSPETDGFIAIASSTSHSLAIKAATTPSNEVWVLTETQVNPNNGRTVFVGGGSMWDYYAEPRFLGTTVGYVVRESFFLLYDRSVEDEHENHEVFLTTEFDRPPMTLIPGEIVSLHASCSHGGTVHDGGVGLQFWYSSSDATIDPATMLGYAPWSPDFAGVSSKTWNVHVPQTRPGELIIYASWWDRPASLVAWKYNAESREETGVYGVFESEGRLDIISPPRARLSISKIDLPAWARDKLVVVGAVVSEVGHPATVISGDPRVVLDGMPVARLGDRTSHGGVIVSGSGSIFINGIRAASVGDRVVCPMLTRFVPHVGGPITTSGRWLGTGPNE